MLRGEVIILGVLVLGVGIVAYAYPQTYCVDSFCATSGYPYRDLGTVLIGMAIVAFIIGAVVGEEGIPLSRPNVGAEALTGTHLCTNCGQPLRPSDVFCPYCGQKAA
jgi:hypothetical protein